MFWSSLSSSLNAHRIVSGIAVAGALILAVALYVESDSLTQERSDAAKALAGERDRAAQLQAELDRLKKGYDELNVLNGQLAKDREALERDRDGQRKRADAAERERSDAEARQADAARHLEAEQQAHAKTQSELTAAEAMIATVKGERDGARAQQAEAARQLAAGQQAYEKARSELAAAEARISAVERERDGLRSRVETAERERSDAAQALQAEQQAHEKTRSELTAARTEISNRDEEIRRLAAKGGESAARGPAAGHQ